MVESPTPPSYVILFREKKLYVLIQITMTSRSDQIRSYDFDVRYVQLPCGREYFGNPRTVNKLHIMHTKVCENCRNAELVHTKDTVDIKISENIYHKLTKGV